MPDLEMWTVNAAVAALRPGQRIRQVGINFGAPGDRRADNGTLWIEYPNSSGETSPLSIDILGTPQFYRRHASSVKEVDLPWVYASGVENARAIRVPLAVGKPATASAEPTSGKSHRVQLFFAEPTPTRAGERVFNVYLQGRLVLKDLDIAAEAKHGAQVVRKSFDSVAIENVLEVRFEPKRGAPILSGIEIQSMP
jgi:hypothetical protein